MRSRSQTRQTGKGLKPGFKPCINGPALQWFAAILWGQSARAATLRFSRQDATSSQALKSMDRSSNGGKIMAWSHDQK
jgi:hypothetical protein